MTILPLFSTESLKPSVYLRFTGHLNLDCVCFKAQKPPVSSGYLLDGADLGFYGSMCHYVIENLLQLILAEIKPQTS